jgi:lysine 2,3-aminomutase
MRIKVRPYYLYHCDPVKGAHHFRTTVAKGLEIIESLRGHTSGLAIPTYVIDAPGGGGKVPIQPQYLLSYEQGRAIIRNFQGRIFQYDDPVYDEGPKVSTKPRFFVPDALNGDITVQQRRLSTNALAGLDPKLVGHVGANGHGKPIFQNVMPGGKVANSAGMNFSKLVVLPANGNGNGNGNGHCNGSANGNGKHNGANGCGH